MSVRTTAPELVAQLRRLRPRLVVGDRDQLDRVIAIADAGNYAIATTEELATTAVAPHRSDGAIDPSAPLAMLCTSGTTGAPNAVVLSSAACYASALAAGKRLDYHEAQSWLATMPLHHVGGLSILLRAAILGAEVVLRDGFHPERTRADIARFAIRHASLVPTMLHRLLTLDTAPSARSTPRSCCFLVGGAALSGELARRATNAGLDVRAPYGMTEAASQVTTTERGEVVEYPETTGRALGRGA